MASPSDSFLKEYEGHLMWVYSLLFSAVLVLILIVGVNISAQEFNGYWSITSENNHHIVSENSFVCGAETNIDVNFILVICTNKETKRQNVYIANTFVFNER